MKPSRNHIVSDCMTPNNITFIFCLIIKSVVVVQWGFRGTDPVCNSLHAHSVANNQPAKPWVNLEEQWCFIPGFVSQGRPVHICRVNHPHWKESLRLFGIPGAHLSRCEKHSGFPSNWLGPAVFTTHRKKCWVVFHSCLKPHGKVTIWKTAVVDRDLSLGCSVSFPMQFPSICCVMQPIPIKCFQFKVTNSNEQLFRIRTGICCLGFLFLG